MYFDAADDDFESLNDADVLDDTPIGTLRVVDWMGAASVAVMDHREPSKVNRIIHTLTVGENPINAVYGKRRHEEQAIGRRYAVAESTKRASADREHILQRGDFRRGLDRFVSKFWDDGREAIAERLVKRGR